MSTRLAAAALVVLALTVVPAAAADGPMPSAQQGGTGVLANDGLTRWVAVNSAEQVSTALESITTDGGVVDRSIDLPGSWGIPMVTYNGGQGDGLSRDGKTLILADVAQTYPKATSQFLVIDTASLLTRRTIQLNGDFAFDALSPDMKTMYLIQHVDRNDMSRYVVRAFRLPLGGKLLPGRIADRAQKSWIMKGYPMSRVVSSGGRWVYTLYQNPGGFPFVHALDTVRRVAHCIAIPWAGSQNGFYNLRLSLRDSGRTLAVHWLSGRRWFAADTRTWRVTRDDRSGFAWRWAAAGAAAAAVLTLGALLLLRRRRGEEFEQELVELLGLPEREVVV
jgi:hypothetical protein